MLPKKVGPAQNGMTRDTMRDSGKEECSKQHQRPPTNSTDQQISQWFQGKAYSMPQPSTTIDVIIKPLPQIQRSLHQQPQ